MLDHKKLAVIHIVKRELELSDEQYRDALEKVTGVRSSMDLDERGFRKLMNYFARSRYYRTDREAVTFRQKIFIQDLKEQLKWTDPHFINLLFRVFRVFRGKNKTSPRTP